MKELLFLTPVLVFTFSGHLALAQPKGHAPKEKKIYAGLQRAKGRYEVLFPAKDVGSQPMTNLRYTLGYWIWPRLAFQTSFVRDQKTINETNYGTTVTGIPTSEGFVNVQTGMAFPFLFRYTLTRNPGHRVQFDALGGVTAVFAGYTLDLMNTEDGVVTRQYHREEQADVAAYLTAGLSSRYRIFHRLDVVADATWSKNPRPVSYDQHASMGNHWGITKSLSLGLSYPFGIGHGKSAY